ncbi:MAG: hypothetical protein ACRC3B_10400, partial [Bacteroidia bacterium]
TLTRIQHLPNKKARTDIRDFAVLMLNIVNLELNNEARIDSLLRSGKSYFGKKERAADFELLVLKHIELLQKTASPAQKLGIITSLLNELEKLTPGLAHTVPVLGVNEVKLWTISRSKKKPLTEVFKDEVLKIKQQVNFESDDNQVKKTGLEN